jgi:hypothetical protein
MKKFTLLPVFILLLLSCTAPGVIAQITPEADEGYYAMGREYISLESDQIGVELGFDGTQGEELVFDFVVHNTTPDTLHILPSDFYYVVLESAVAEASSDTSWLAVSPDMVLLNYSSMLEERQEEKKRNSLLGIVQAGVGILFNTTAFFATDDPGYLADAVLHTAGTADQYVSQDKMISSEMEMISEEKVVVDEEIFRACEVPPGKVVNGYVYFPRHNKTPYYMFSFPIENQLFQFVYQQPVIPGYN